MDEVTGIILMGTAVKPWNSVNAEPNNTVRGSLTADFADKQSDIDYCLYSCPWSDTECNYKCWQRKKARC